MTTADPTRIDRLRWFLTFHVPGAYRLRCWWRARKDRPGWRPSDFR
jgi:hypothetical protein